MSALAETTAGLPLTVNADAEQARLSDIARQVLELARRGGADQAEVGVSSSHERNVTVRLGEIDVLEDARDRGVSVTVYRKRASGSASTADLSAASLQRTVEHALAIARHTQPDPAGGLADAERMATEIADFGQWHPAEHDIDALIARAREIEQAGRDADPRIDNSEGASVSSSAHLGVYANSHGFLGSGRGTSFGQSCVLIARDERGMQRDWDWDERGRFDQLNAPEYTGRRAAERALARLGVKPAPTGRVPVLFTPEVALGLVRHLVGAVSGGNLYRRSSFLVDAAGTRLFPDWVQIDENPHLTGASRSSSFDSEGVATRPAPLVADGVLARYVLGSYAARKLDLETTANAGGVRNLVFAPGERSQAELIREMGRGLVVSEVMGQGVNLVTGDYSRGASGYWVENGELAWPVEEITIAGNLRDMFAGLAAAGSDVETRRNVQVPSILIDGMMVAGQGESMGGA
ncbi:MAG: metalloprotease PmbA [Wenzhouxiangellaceae bacterium]|nr:metalloprotease PmbA [Wenzhouxiangellaceae bacterium]